MTKKVYKLKIFFSVVTKNPNWEILTKNLVEHVKKNSLFGKSVTLVSSITFGLLNV